MKTYSNPVYAYRRSPDQDGDGAHYPVIVVGAGPVGMAAAIDLAQRDIPVLVLDDDQTVSVGSRAICWAKRTLEILDRLGCGEPVARKGVGWNVGKVYHKDDLVFQFDLLPEHGHRRPAFVNLQQYYVEEYLVERAAALPAAEIRWMNKVVGVTPGSDRVTLRVDTPEGDYVLSCDWLIVADGARSPVRTMLGLEAEGQVFRDRFLIADIHMKSDFPPERRFWFDPPFHPNQSALLHRQADDVWRVDFQLGWDADPEEEKKPENILPRLHAMLGDDAQFDIEWASVYTFQCRRMQQFRHGRVVFAGDAAHLVSPFGARGANSGIQDTDNLVWKLKLVIDGRAPERLLDSYDVETDRGGRREHPELDALDRLHHAEERDVAHVPRCGALARQAPRVRAPARQQRPPVGAGGVDRFAAQYAGPRSLCRRDGAGRAGRRRAGDGPGIEMVRRLSGRRLHPRRLRRGGARRSGRRTCCATGFRAASSTSERTEALLRPTARSGSPTAPACSRSATTDGREPAISSGPISTSARGGAPSTPARCARRSRARPAMRDETGSCHGSR